MQGKGRVGLLVVYCSKVKQEPVKAPLKFKAGYHPKGSLEFLMVGRDEGAGMGFLFINLQGGERVMEGVARQYPYLVKAQTFAYQRYAYFKHGDERITVGSIGIHRNGQEDQLFEGLPGTLSREWRDGSWINAELEAGSLHPYTHHALHYIEVKTFIAGLAERPSRP